MLPGAGERPHVVQLKVTLGSLVLATVLATGSACEAQSADPFLVVLSRSGASYAGGVDRRLTVHHDGLAILHERGYQGETRQARWFVDPEALSTLQSLISGSGIWVLEGNYLMLRTVGADGSERFEFTMHDDIVRLFVVVGDRRHRVVGGKYLPAIVHELADEIERLAGMPEWAEAE